MDEIKRRKGPDTSALDTAEGRSIAVTAESIWALFEKGRGFNARMDLEETVRVNENFFIGKQWEGVVSNGLPTPVFNILKRVCCFIVATITSDNIKVQASPLANSPGTSKLIEPVRIVNEELDALTEHNSIPSLMREYARNAAVDGDGCTYTYWDPDAETGQSAKGAIRTECLENTRVFFGNPNDRQVQSQPYIIISRREIVGKIRREAKESGAENWRDICPDTDSNNVDSHKTTDDKVTVLTLLWREEESGEIWAVESTKDCIVRGPRSLGIRLYPITWLNWDYVQDSYHGQAMITGLIPNQIFINKTWAMSMISLMTTAYPKVVYDKTRVSKWDNRIGAAIGIAGGDVNNVAKIIDPAAVSPQISQFIQAAVEQTEQSLGATSVALGDTRPDNTSAIIALQRAAATPSEITKQNLYRSIEELFRIYMEFMAEYYGKRKVDIATPEQVRELYAFAGQQPPAEIETEFDFKQLKEMPMSIKLDVGASSYYSEIASIQTLGNLLQNGNIDTVQYLERIPDGYIPGRRELIAELKAARQQQAQMMQAQMGQVQETTPQQGGFNALTEKVMDSGGDV